jgi:hypothetical protein
MRRMQLNRISWVVVCLLAALPAPADTRFQIRRMTRDDVPRGKGQCDVRLQVDGQVEVSVQGDGVFIRTLSGQDARDDGSECNAPLPPRDVRGFGFEVKDSRGDIKLVEEPSDRNGGRAVVRIRDSAGGFGRYHFRLSWDLFGGGGDRPQERRDGDRPPERRDGDRPQERRDDDRRSDLRVISGFWGAPGRGREVTRLLQDRMRDGRLRIRATNEDLGFDPARGQEKMLIVNFEFRGRRQEVRVREGDFLELPQR